MKLISWNVNSIHARLPRVTALLARYRPDVVCLQEIKTTAKEFPAADFAALGYQAATRSWLTDGRPRPTARSPRKTSGAG
jgi:exodeoxyribonuclease III